MDSKQFGAALREGYAKAIADGHRAVFAFNAEQPAYQFWRNHRMHPRIRQHGTVVGAATRTGVSILRELLTEYHGEPPEELTENDPRFLDFAEWDRDREHHECTMTRTYR